MAVHVAPEPIVITADNQIAIRSCDLYRRHFSPILEWHHVCPKSWFVKAGKPVATPMIFLCGTCHDTVHAAIDGLITGKGVDQLPLRCVKLARQALTLAYQNGLTPARTL
jgi:hypothetical protein